MPDSCYDPEFEAWWADYVRVAYAHELPAENPALAPGKRLAYDAWRSRHKMDASAERPTMSPGERLASTVQKLSNEGLLEPTLDRAISFEGRLGTIDRRLNEELHYVELIEAAKRALVEVRADLVRRTDYNGGWQRCCDALDAVLSKIGAPA